MAAPRRLVAWLADSLAEAGSRFDPRRALQEICRTAGTRHACFVMRHVPGVVGDDPFRADTYGDPWRRHVEENGALLLDPIPQISERAVQPIDWSELPRGRVKNKRFLRDFHEFQLGRQALTATFRGPSGDRSLFTLTSDVTEKRWIAIKHDIAAAISLLHPAFHLAVMRNCFRFQEIEVPRLTPRERECLVWAAHGRTSKEIGETLGLTPATVNFFIDAAVNKLSASNRAHAAAKVVALGLIAPPR